MTWIRKDSYILCDYLASDLIELSSKQDTLYLIDGLFNTRLLFGFQSTLPKTLLVAWYYSKKCGYSVIVIKGCRFFQFNRSSRENAGGIGRELLE